MIKIENTKVVGFEEAIRGMRNPMNSWEKSDSVICKNNVSGMCVGNNDLNLMKRLVKAGTDHRKFMRMITVYVDITAPLYWWKEFDTYKIGTVANSCSTMHKIADKEFTESDFSTEHLIDIESTGVEFANIYGTEHTPIFALNMTIRMLNFYREKYLETKKEAKQTQLIKKYWWQMIQLLPSSYNQRRTVMLNYEVLANIYKSRSTHKLDEWRTFCEWIENLPYGELITGKEDKNAVCV